MKKQLLVVEGNAKATSAVMSSLGAEPYGPSYATLLEFLAPDVTCTVVRPAEEGPDCLPMGNTFQDYHGIVWTGSALNCYNTIPEVTHQITMAKTAYASGVPIFGSCWGLQIFVVALGGVVRLNPKGREIGFARNIQLNEVGERHPMYADKGAVFDAFAVHMDEVETLPEHATLLASNALSRVQAVAIESEDNSFWGVQYHPEFDYQTMAVVYRRLANVLVKEGFYADEKEVEFAARDYEKLEGDTKQQEQHDLAPEMLSQEYRTLEISNWLKEKVLKS